MYIVIKYFTDLQDNERPYNVGDIFPRQGLKVTEERFAELASDKNRRKEPLIKLIEAEKNDAEPVKEEKAPKKTASRAKKAASVSK